MRSRGEALGDVFNADAVADQFGVVKSSYEAVAVPQVAVCAARCAGPGERPMSYLRSAVQPARGRTAASDCGFPALWLLSVSAATRVRW
jgi:hypothetical protein